MCRRFSILSILCVVILAGRADSQFDAFDSSPGAKTESNEVIAKLVADVTAIQPGKPFTLAVAFTVPEGLYFYYKSPGAGSPTKIGFEAPAGFAVGPVEFPGPEVKYDQIGKSLYISNVYKHDTLVLATVTPPDDLQTGSAVDLLAVVTFQFCSTKTGSCSIPKPQAHRLSLPVVADSETVEASESAAAIAATRDSLPIAGPLSKYAKVSARLEPSSLLPGGKAELLVEVDVDPGYKLQMNQPPHGLVSTDLILDPVSGLEPFPLPIYPEPAEPKTPIAGFEDAKEYRGRFVIRVPLEATADLAGDQLALTGLLRYQACDEAGVCHRPMFASFEVLAPVTGGAAAGPLTESSPAASIAGSELGPDADGSDAAIAATAAAPLGEILQYLLLGFVGGLILNVMPCVLPVIPIKIMSFVQQSGEHQSRVLMLNLFYTLGVLAVFWTLATLSVVFSLAWGEQFQRPEFNLVMAAVMFSMGLALLGVFEIPIPGFMGSASGGQDREGPVGAFLSGVIAMVLATPCTGPAFASALTWAVVQPPIVIFAVFTAMGLGMALPFLVTGFYPAAVRWLPKPGNWMVVFKHVCGFFLMGTVIYFVSILQVAYVLPCLVILLGIGFGLWMIGNLYHINSATSTKVKVRLTAAATVFAICWFGLTYVKTVAEYRKNLDDALLIAHAGASDGSKGVLVTGGSESELPWEVFFEKRIEWLSRNGKTVLVDFTSDY